MNVWNERYVTDIEMIRICEQVRELCEVTDRCDTSILNLPSLFTARHFWRFHNKLHNMKALVIRSHRDHHFSHLLVFMKKMNFCGSLWALLEYVRGKKTPHISSFQDRGSYRDLCQIFRNTLLNLPSLKANPQFYCSCWFQLDWQCQEHSLVMRNIY